MAVSIHLKSMLKSIISRFQTGAPTTIHFRRVDLINFNFRHLINFDANCRRGNSTSSGEQRWKVTENDGHIFRWFALKMASGTKESWRRRRRRRRRRPRHEGELNGGLPWTQRCSPYLRYPYSFLFTILTDTTAPVHRTKQKNWIRHLKYHRHLHFNMTTVDSNNERITQF